MTYNYFYMLIDIEIEVNFWRNDLKGAGDYMRC